MFAAASALFARSAISQHYTIGQSTSAAGSRSSTPGPGERAPPGGQIAPTVTIGLWKIQPATHRTTNKRVSVWTFDKRTSEIERLGPQAKDRVLEVLKSEVGALGRMRHPSILEMVEPLEDTRTELIFATEPILSSLELSIPGQSRGTPLVELDEVEIQKGILQLCKGLSFLHTSGKLIHTHICPESIIINAAGDWKIGGLGLILQLLQPNGSPARWEFPTYDSRIPGYIQRSFDYMAPEYAIDERLETSSDMYSLGCLLYAVHSKGRPPYKTNGTLGGIRENAGKPLTGITRLDNDLQALLQSLITRTSQGRPTPSSLPSHPWFSGLAISTLSFLDRANFSTKSREEKISFMKGLSSVLGKFSDGLKTRKILPTLLEEMRDTHLLPYILPNVFAISNILSSQQFASLVLPSLKPLFAIKEPPQNMLTLLDNLTMLQSKTEKNVFRGEVLPLVYNALESEHAVVQERALSAIPDLCETIDYAEVQGVIFPRVAIVFSKTRVLSVKVATLLTFLAMVKTLDQSSLTQKLVPLLSKIRTKEPAVMMATLSVQEAMGFKVDREAVATLVLPQLWSMSVGPLLNVDQFARFMGVIRKLGDRIEKEHTQFLRDSQRLEDRSGTAVNGIPSGPTLGGTVDFASLVGGANGATVKADSTLDASTAWDNDDVWGSILTSGGDQSAVQSPSLAPMAATIPSSPAPRPQSYSSPQRAPIPSFPSSSSSSGTRPYNTGFTSPPRSPSVGSTAAFTNATRPAQRPAQSFAPVSSPMAPTPPQRPNYQTSLSATTSTMQSTMQPASPAPPAWGSFGMTPTSTYMSTPPLAPVMSGLMAPSKPAQPAWGQPAKPSNNDWLDFDPLL